MPINSEEISGNVYIFKKMLHEKRDFCSHRSVCQSRECAHKHTMKWHCFIGLIKASVNSKHLVYHML